MGFLTCGPGLDLISSTFELMPFLPQLDGPAALAFCCFTMTLFCPFSYYNLCCWARSELSEHGIVLRIFLIFLLSVLVAWMRPDWLWWYSIVMWLGCYLLSLLLVDIRVGDCN